ncbi:Vacuolar amino acid transporter 6 [Tolypocladium ophioglossoides CBS 100239]|uniref:Vacuolar amino acid transporter 6 n=1 Tax=Tolypocladium ophioglossoides (strain CBS 100239) TaxID=1163406 RepID=A0A0L0N1C0_TOLOC|nr:Vacuolar amino acid transporter 6 [Tolypocladium ophioglossoides CBS 100239]
MSNLGRTRRRGGKEGHGGQASTISSIVNLLNTSAPDPSPRAFSLKPLIGAGTLAMPSVMSHMGIMLGVVLILWSGVTAAFGQYLQSKCARYLDRGSSSFFALSQITYSGASVIFDLAIAVKCFGVGVSYMIIIGDLMPGVMLGFDDRAAEIPYLVDRHFWITAFMLLVIPLSFLRRLDSLKYTSIVALVSIGYLIVLVIYHFAADPHADPKDIRVIQWAGAVETLSALPVVVFAYTCHQNVGLSRHIRQDLANALPRCSPLSMKSRTTLRRAWLEWWLPALVRRPASTSWSQSRDPTGVASTIGKAAIVVLVLFSVPLQIHPCRASLDAVLKWRPNRSTSNGGRPVSPLMNPSATTPRGDHGSTAPMSDTRFALLTTVILTMAYITALSVSSLDRVLAFVGSTGSTSISFILPGLFYYKISDPESIHHQRLMKADDDIDDEGTSDVEESGGILTRSASGANGATPRTQWRWRRKWRWDLEHLDHGLVRKLSLSLAIYGMVVMAVCLLMNIFFAVAH